jgi:methionyl aminopeptidase
MWAGIRAVRPGARLGDVGHAIQQLAERAGYAVVRGYGGHGIGTVYHEDLHVPHFGRPGTGPTLVPGMVFSLAPMIYAGKHPTRSLAVGLTVVTVDRSLSAQWEHMVAVTPSGCDVLTLAPGEVGA